MIAAMQQSPLLILSLHTLFSAGGLSWQLHESKEGRAAANRIAELGWSGGTDVDIDDALRLGGEVLEAAAKTQLGTFFAASLAAGCAAGITLATKAFFLGGQLSDSETTRLAERLLKFLMLKGVALAVQWQLARGGFLQWLAWTVVMGQALLFTKLASLRGDALLRSPSATLAQHLRVLALLGGILAQDVSWIVGFLGSGMGNGSLSHAALWLFDATFVAVDAAHALAKYAVHAVDHHQAAQAEAAGEERTPWEGQSALVYWLELSADVSLLTLALGHYLHLWWLQGLRMELTDGVLFLEVKFLVGAIQRRVQRYLASRRLNHSVRHTLPDATQRQLDSGPCCICLETMKTGKQLPCSHTMHSACLCAWIEQSPTGRQTCPLCRASLEVEPPQQQAQQAQRQHSWLPHIGLGGRPDLQPATSTAGPLQQQYAAFHGSSHVPVDVYEAEQPLPGEPLFGEQNAASRPFTRSQARMAAAGPPAAPAPSPAAPAGRSRGGRPPRQMDRI